MQGSTGRIITLAVLTLAASSAVAQSYPNRPIRAVTAAVGGGIDFTARLVAHGLTNAFGQQVIVDNRGGTGVAQGTVAKATPDGYTILINNNTVWLSPLLEKVHYDYEKELIPVCLTTRSPAVLVVHPSMGVSSVKELIALAKATPGDINYASGPMGAANHLSAELFKALAGVNLVRIGYKGGGPALNDLLAGQVKVMFATAGSVMPHIKSGKLRGLAVTSAQASPLVPGLPSVAASGVPGYESEAIYGMFVPARTPPGHHRSPASGDGALPGDARDQGALLQFRRRSRGQLTAGIRRDHQVGSRAAGQDHQGCRHRREVALRPDAQSPSFAARSTKLVATTSM